MKSKGLILYLFQKMEDHCHGLEANLMLTDNEQPIASQPLMDLSSLSSKFDDGVGQGELINKLTHESSRHHKFGCAGVLLQGHSDSSKTLVAKATHARKAVKQEEQVEEVVISVTNLGDMIIAFASNDEPEIFIAVTGDMIIITPADDLPGISASPNFSSEIFESIDLEESLM